MGNNPGSGECRGLFPTHQIDYNSDEEIKEEVKPTPTDDLMENIDALINSRDEILRHLESKNEIQKNIVEELKAGAMLKALSYPELSVPEDDDVR